MMFLHFLLWYCIYAVVSLFSLWVYYLAVMNLKRVNDTQGLNAPSKDLGAIVLAIGYFLDFNADIGVITVIGFEMPSEPTVTARLKRWKASGNWWQQKVAYAIKPILDPFDPSGVHID